MTKQEKNQHIIDARNKISSLSEEQYRVYNDLLEHLNLKKGQVEEDRLFDYCFNGINEYKLLQ